MSRTDKDVPWRIKQYREGYISHNHERGECREETRERALRSPSAAGWAAWRHHWRHCAKYERVTVPCPGYKPADEFSFITGERYRSLTRWHRWPCERARDRYIYPFHVMGDEQKWKARQYLRTIYCTDTHTKKVYHGDWPCVCDDREVWPTCDYVLGPEHRGWRYGRGSVPGWYVHANYHDPMRARVRDDLRRAAQEWNGSGDTDVEPDVSQGRGSMRWNYW